MINNNNNETASDFEQTMNANIYSRNFPSSVIYQPLDHRPVPTKYMPYIQNQNQNKPLYEDIQPPYDVYETFNPGTRKSPWTGYVKNIDTESRLKNQTIILQKYGGYPYPINDNVVYKTTYNTEKTVNVFNNSTRHQYS